LTVQILSPGYVQNGQCAFLSLSIEKGKKNQGVVTLTNVVYTPSFFVVLRLSISPEMSKYGYCSELTTYMPSPCFTWCAEWLVFLFTAGNSGAGVQSWVLTLQYMHWPGLVLILFYVYTWLLLLLLILYTLTLILCILQI